MSRAVLCCAIMVFLGMCLSTGAQSVSSTSEDEDALNAATQRLCRTQVAMLGESATHGDGHTLAFKVALVERLVDRCGFDSVFFEANHDEFIHLNKRLRAGQVVTSSDVLAAVGGLWSFYREFQPLASFLLTRAQAGRIFLAGIDDQLGQVGQDYANAEMIAELTDLLAQPERQRCSTALYKRVNYDYSDAAPYSKGDRSQIATCLSEIQAVAAANKTTREPDGEERLEMISATQRWVDRDFSSDADNVVNRDRSMFRNFEWLQSRLPKRHKVIVWAATVHIAKQGDPTWGDRAGTNLGFLIKRRYGNRAYSLGFSAVSGSYRQGKGKFQAMPSAPPNSVEIQALQGGASDKFVALSQLASMGTIPGALFRHSYQTLSWSDFLDGVVVFRAEYPPSDTRDK